VTDAIKLRGTITLSNLTVSRHETSDRNADLSHVSEHDEADGGVLAVHLGHHGVTATQRACGEATGRSDAPVVLGCGKVLDGLQRANNGPSDDAWLSVAIEEEASDAEGGFDGGPVAGDGHEAIPWEQRDFDGVGEGTEDAVATSDAHEREEGVVALAAEVGFGPALGLWVGLDDGPIATARAFVPSGELSRIGPI